MTPTVVDDSGPTELKRPSAAAWRERQQAAPRWTPSSAPMVVVVPHADDETLSVGGLISQQRLAGVDVSIIAVTDGDAAYDPDGDAVLAAHRTQEQNAALDRLGVASAARRRLGFPDSRVHLFEDDLAAVLMDVDPAATLVAPSHLDVHPDHEAVGRAARRAATARGSDLIEYFFWAWHLRLPDELDDDLVAYELAAGTIERKSAAIANHRSQTETWEGHAPVLDATLLEPARWPNEYFVVRRP